MKKITIEFKKDWKSKRLKKQIESLAKLANKNPDNKYYLQYLQFELFEDNLRISGTSGHILSDIIVTNFCNSDLEKGKKLHIKAEAFLKINQTILEIEIGEKEAKINGTFIADILEANKFPNLDEVRLKEKPPVTICFNATSLKSLADCLEMDVVTISFNPEFPKKPIMVIGKKSNGLLMPAIM